MWPEAVYWITDSGAFREVQAKVSCCLFCPGPSGMSYKAICRFLLLVLGLEVPRGGQPVNKGWLLIVLSLGPLSKWYRAHHGQMLLIWET